MAEDRGNGPSISAPNRRSGAETLLFKVIPIAGSVSYEIFSANITNPKQFIKLFTPHELTVANCLWFNSHLGAGLFIYSRRHIEKASVPHRVLYSALGSVLFNFGSVLLWATVKAIVPPNPRLRVGLGGLSGLLILYLSYSYLTFVDSLASRCLPLNEDVLIELGQEVD